MNRWFTGRPWEPEDISPHQTEFATSLRVPFLNSIYPRWNFITGIAVDDLYNGIAPTDEEVEVVSELVKSYKDYFFGQNAFRMEMEAFAPYDLDGGAIGFYFIKHADETWSYRRSSWRDGYPFRPGYDEPKMTLQEVIERGDLRWQRATAH